MSDLNIPLQDRDYLSDQVRREFLKDLDEADHIDLNDWEAEFVGRLAWGKREEYTPRQRAVIDKMREKYGSRL